jgi:hypothetical protein
MVTLMPTSSRGQKRPRDTNQLAKLMVDILTGEDEDRDCGREYRRADSGCLFSARRHDASVARPCPVEPRERWTVRGTALNFRLTHYP